MASNFGGYDYSFVDKNLERFTCETICTKVLKNPHLTVCCGQHFCESCLDNWFTKHRKESCPYCRAERKEFQHFLDKKLKREIDSLRIHCTNKEEGCQWIGELRSLKDHLESVKGCGYVEVECTNECIDNPTTILFPMWQPVVKKKMKRKDLDNHVKKECYLRPYKCEHCGHGGTYQDITGAELDACSRYLGDYHYNKCSEFPLDCPNRCGRNDIKRKHMKKHRSQCPEEKVTCPNRCQPQRHHKMKRKILHRHLKEHCILRPYQCEHCGKKDTYKAIVTEHYGNCPEFPVECPNKCGIKDIKRKDMKDHRSQCPEEPIQCPFEEAGCKEKLVRYEMEQHMSATQQQHLLMVMGAYKETKKENKEMKCELYQVKEELTQTKAELKQTKDDHQKLKTTLRNQGTISDDEEEEEEEEEEDEEEYFNNYHVPEEDYYYDDVLYDPVEELYYEDYYN